MKNIGMIVACEIDAVLGRYGSPLSREERCGFPVLTYAMGENRLTVVHTGVGELAAAAAAALLIDRYEAELIVNFGVVGGLTEEMAQTRCCVVEKLVHYDFDTSHIDGTLPGQYEGYESIYIPATQPLLERALALCPELKKVTCASADKFVDGREKKAELHRLYGADICEMEAAGIALTCRRAGVPFLLIKAVSDGIEGGAAEFHAELERCSALCLELTDRIIREI